MPKMRVTFAFSVGKQGWSETFFRDSTLDEAVIAATQLATVRFGCLVGGNTAFDYIRVSDDAVRRDATIIPPAAVPKPKLTCQDIEAAPPYNCRLCRLSNGANPPRFLDLRPIPAASLLPTQVFQPVPQFDKAVDRYLDALKLGWGINALSGLANPSKQIISYAALNGVVTVTSPLHNFVNGQSIRISGGQGPGRPKGLFRVTNITNNTFDLIGLFQPFLYFGGSIASSQFKTPIPINRAIQLRNSHRDTGRPFGVQAGRSRARK